MDPIGPTNILGLLTDGRNLQNIAHCMLRVPRRDKNCAFCFCVIIGKLPAVTLEYHAKCHRLSQNKYEICPELPQPRWLCYNRETLCVSAVSAVVRCPSVTFVYCIHTTEYIVKRLSWPDSPIIIGFFDHERRYTIPRGTPSAGTLNTRGRKNLQLN